jgi:hypothetical protein
MCLPQGGKNPMNKRFLQIPMLVFMAYASLLTSGQVSKAAERDIHANHLYSQAMSSPTLLFL